jgi:type II secretory pathway pseudopilin PulG
MVELLVVITVIGILATIGIARFGGVKDRARVATLRADLRNLVTDQEAHYINFGVYASSIVPDGPATAAAMVFNQTEGSDAPVVTLLAGDGYNATITSQVTTTPTTCAVSVGGSAPWPRSVGGSVLTAPGQIVCP